MSLACGPVSLLIVLRTALRRGAGGLTSFDRFAGILDLEDVSVGAAYIRQEIIKASVVLTDVPEDCFAQPVSDSFTDMPDGAGLPESALSYPDILNTA